MHKRTEIYDEAYRKLGEARKAQGGFFAFFPENQDHISERNIRLILWELENKNDQIKEQRAEKRHERYQRTLRICRGYGPY